MAGVSRGTVDRVLNCRGNVNPDVAERVKMIAAEIGYTPNRAGRALVRSGKPLKFGVILDSIDNPFFEDILSGISAGVKEYEDFNLSSVLKQSKGYDVRKQLVLIDEAVSDDAAAVIIAPINDRAVAKKIDTLTHSGIPVLCINSDIEDCNRAAYVGCDYIASGKTAAGLLGLMLGSQNDAEVGIVAGSLKMLGHKQRVDGFLSACRTAVRVCEVVENNDDDVTSYIVTKKLLTSNPGINALYFAAAGVAGGVRAIDEFFDSGKKRPIIIACDNTEDIRKLVLEGKIQVTVCQQPFRQGYESVRSLVDLIINHKTIGNIYMENEIKIKENI